MISTIKNFFEKDKIKTAESINDVLFGTEDNVEENTTSMKSSYYDLNGSEAEFIILLLHIHLL